MRRAAKLLAAGAAVALAALAGATAISTGKRNPPPSLPPASSAQAIHLPFGPVNPRKPLPPIRLTMDDGTTTGLAEATRGKWTLLQLMYTNCATTCPLQGAIFQQAQQQVAATKKDARLLSVSVDPQHDDPAALMRWRATFEAGGNWRAGAVAQGDLGALLDLFNGRRRSLDVHDARVYFIDPQGRLAYATENLPDPAALIRLLQSAQ